ncbi:hypothetical protein KFL_006500070 [Klebsormidium nitens]|uniref:Uncharacterized protein n=1 Tax=Klebsormidium nitens TaxID=105231 RepID=A0A1Y1III2_KLENI|nr:hypothetical protein KFL_006500070 [Klebsormidium nitens]|eukprot:GAQ90513.1 hypothetical protein KFL_006500070 [Klebsormidium nitens]
MAAFLRVLVLLLVCGACWSGAAAQGPANLTLVQANSTATVEQQGAATLSLKFTPSTVQLAGIVEINATSCSGAGLPADVVLLGTNISTLPPNINISASSLGSNIGSFSLTNLTLNISALSFPVNPSNGSFQVVVNTGTAHVDALNGTLTGNQINQMDVSLQFQNQSAVVNGSFVKTAGGLDMRASSVVTIPLSEIVDAAGFGGNALVTTATAGGSIQIPINLLASGNNTCANPTPS